MAEWGLPPEVLDAVRDHHRPERSGAAATWAVALADAGALAMAGEEPDLFVTRDALAALGIVACDFDGVVSRAEQRFAWLAERYDLSAAA